MFGDCARVLILPLSLDGNPTKRWERGEYKRIRMESGNVRVLQGPFCTVINVKAVVKPETALRGILHPRAGLSVVIGRAFVSVPASHYVLRRVAVEG